MARCEECKANKICDHNRFGFENCGNFIPADVVPKSEVKKIFEDITDFILTCIENDEKVFNSGEDEYYDGRFVGFKIIEEHLVELKKKYTESGNEND